MVDKLMNGSSLSTPRRPEIGPMTDAEVALQAAIYCRMVEDDASRFDAALAASQYRVRQ